MDSEKLEAHRQFIYGLSRLPKGFTPTGSFQEICAAVMGYDVGSGREFLREFQAWIGNRQGRPELAFPHHVALEALGDVSILEPLSSDQNDRANRVLFAWLTECFGEPSSNSPWDGR